MSGGPGGARGARMLALVRRLYPICRSITGEGVRETLRLVAQEAPLEIHEVPSGTQVFDWTVPDEWNVREAWIAGPDGKRVVDFRDHNLHLVSYSTPVRGRFSREALLPHLHCLEDRPDWIPYRTSYYHRDWGFCLTKRQRDALAPGEYEVCVDATLAPGALSYGELALPGETPDEIVFSAHVCHPSLCNDNLSGIAVAASLARELAGRRRRLGYRFLFIPGTIGSLSWLARNRERVPHLRGGLSLVCLGDERPLRYKRSFAGDGPVDRAAALVLRERGRGEESFPFFPFGYDERQFNAPGFRIPYGSLMRGQHGQFPEYHTSADDLGFVSGERLGDALDACLALCEALEADRRYRNLAPYGEPQLGRRGIYRAMGGTNLGDLSTAMLWVLQLSDGGCSLLEIADRSGLPVATIARAAELLHQHELLGEV